MPVGEVATAARISNPATGESASVTKDRNKRLVVGAGDQVELFVTGVDVGRVSMGNVVCHSRPDLRVPVRGRFVARIMTYANIKVPVIKGTELVMHMSNVEVPVVVGKICNVVKRGEKTKTATAENNKGNRGDGGGDDDGANANANANANASGKGTPVKNKITHRLLAAGDSGLVKIKVADRHRKLCLETFADCRALGRFVLRRNGETVGMGVVTELLQSKHKK